MTTFVTDANSSADATSATSSSSEIKSSENENKIIVQDKDYDSDITAWSDHQCKPMLQESHDGRDNGDIHIINTSHDPQPIFQ